MNIIVIYFSVPESRNIATTDEHSPIHSSVKRRIYVVVYSSVNRRMYQGQPMFFTVSYQRARSCHALQKCSVQILFPPHEHTPPLLNRPPPSTPAPDHRRPTHRCPAQPPSDPIVVQPIHTQLSPDHPRGPPVVIAVWSAHLWPPPTLPLRRPTATVQLQGRTGVQALPAPGASNPTPTAPCSDATGPGAFNFRQV
jgi:hypothetical protein